MEKNCRKLLALITAVIVLFVSTNSVAASSTTNIVEELLESVTNDENVIVNDEYEVYGNTDLTDKEFRDIVNRGGNKVYLHYRTDKNIELPYDALLKIKTSAKTYSFEYSEMENTNSDFIRSGIREFLLIYSAIINTRLEEEENVSAIALTSNTSVTFEENVVQNSYVKRFSDKGYIVYDIAVSRYIVNSNSILYIVTVNNAFVPGIVAKKNGETGYANFKNQEGFVHMTVEQAYDATQENEYGIRYGNIPYLKDYWPLNGPGVVSITSSIQAGLNIGYSFENGFSLDNITVGSSADYGANISYAYSKTIQRTEPALSVQRNSSNLDKCEWYYTYAENAEETYHQQTNYMFEISNSRNGMFIGDFRLKLDFKFVVHRDFWPTTSTNEFSVDLFVRAGEYTDIYDFADGMV